MTRGEAGHGLLGAWTQGKAQTTCSIIQPPFHRRDCWRDGLMGELKCSMTQIHLFYLGESAKAGSRARLP